MEDLEPAGPVGCKCQHIEPFSSHHQVTSPCLGQATHEDNASLSKEKEELTAQLQELQSRYLDTTGCLEASLTKTESQLSQTR